MKIKDLFGNNPKTWAKGVGARDKDNDAIDPKSDFACSWCLYGAARKCSNSDEEYMEISNKLNKEIKKRFGKFMTVSEFNDSEASFQDIMNLVISLNI